MDPDRLIQAALQARQRAWAPYSGFGVGAAILAVSGKIYTGCNIENASYGATICAERAAVAQAVSAGERYFSAVAVVGFSSCVRPADRPLAWPCGICRQVLSEFSGPDLPVYVARSATDYVMLTLGQLLPYQFGSDQLAPEPSD
ncbi:cytidine deaminase [Oscillospiraceae bacterium HV4-5-C5C]|nr:cytidine deaminase [Oscillospiraceae bacterium HV4-5-C5C]